MRGSGLLALVGITLVGLVFAFLIEFRYSELSHERTVERLRQRSQAIAAIRAVHRTTHRWPSCPSEVSLPATAQGVDFSLTCPPDNASGTYVFRQGELEKTMILKSD